MHELQINHLILNITILKNHYFYVKILKCYKVIKLKIVNNHDLNFLYKNKST